jgi:hypothetical protein
VKRVPQFEPTAADRRAQLPLFILLLTCEVGARVLWAVTHSYAVVVPVALLPFLGLHVYTWCAAKKRHQSVSYTYRQILFSRGDDDA